MSVYPFLALQQCRVGGRDGAGSSTTFTDLEGAVVRGVGIDHGRHISGLFTEEQTEVIEIKDDGESFFNKGC